MSELNYFNALMNSVVGNDDQKKAAKEYLAQVDPDIWDKESQGPAVLRGRACRYGCDENHPENLGGLPKMSVGCAKILLSNNER